jgi:hypothetical protein
MLHTAARRRPRRTRTGRVPLPRSDGRTVTSRRFRDLVEAYSAEIGGELSEADRSLVMQAAAIQIRCEELQLELVEGRDIDPDMLIRLSSEHRRLMAGLGARADKSKPAGPALQDYLATKYGAQPAGESVEDAEA